LAALIDVYRRWDQAEKAAVHERDRRAAALVHAGEVEITAEERARLVALGYLNDG
jgi:hypothetical protein